MNQRRFLVVLATTLPLILLFGLLSWFPKSPTATWQQAAAAGTVITVTTHMDNGPGGSGNDGPPDPDNCDPAAPSGECTLREAIEWVQDNGNGYHITFAQPYTIVLTYRGATGDDPVQALPYLSRDNIDIDGDLNNDCEPDVVINGENITQTSKSGLLLFGDDGTIEGLVVQNFLDYGVVLAGSNLTLTCSYLGTDLSGRQAAPNRLGVYLTGNAHDNLVTHNVIAGNRQNGVHIQGHVTDTTRTPYSNTIQHNWIGTNPQGDALGNEEKGIVILINTRDNLVYDNQIYYNGCLGVHLRGLSTTYPDVVPPRGNRIISNTIAANATTCSTGGGGLLSEDTHMATSNTLPSLIQMNYDNLIASNLIRDNEDRGIANLGGSPLITGNRVVSNASYGIWNEVDFRGTFSPLNADDDILSIPLIINNTIEENNDHGIRSLDTSPVAPYRLHISNTIQNNNQAEIDGPINVSQAWYGLTELLYGNVTTTKAITRNAVANITYLDAGYIKELDQPIPVTLTQGSVVYVYTVWADNNTDDYFDVSTWVAVPQFEVSGTVMLDYSPKTINAELQGGITLTATFSYDGLTDTHPVTNDLLVPAYIETGPYGRYQVAQVYKQASSSGGDTDGDGIADEDEPIIDTDEDGTPDYLDPDDDGDGIDTEDEAQTCDPGDDQCVCEDGVCYVDTDEDGTPDYLDSDDDGDGVSTEDEAQTCDPGDDQCVCEDGVCYVDTDEDGTPDYLDPDDDDDGILSEDEIGECTEPGDHCICYDGGPPDGYCVVDTDGDGTPDYLDTDSDEDGIPDAEEGADDTDNDGTPDYLDPDADGDGIPDWEEAGCEDEDEDGQADEDSCPAEMPDADEDGIPDYLEDNFADIDGDGIPNYQDEDSDGDGIPDDDEYYDGSEGDSTFCTEPSTQDTDGDSIPDCQDNDVDGDGIPNYLDGDSDGDGILDTDEYDADGDGNPDDSDEDGIPDWIDPAEDADTTNGGDSDGDGISDVEEAGENPADPVDTDNDGIPDYLDTIENIQGGDVMLTGPAMGKVGVGATFTATVPITPTAPFTYVWTTPAGIVTRGPLKARVNTFIFTGTTTGTHTITVTVINGQGNNSGQDSASRDITLSASAVALTAVSVEGPDTGSVLFSHTFTATFQPQDAAPVTFGWTTTGDPTSAISETNTFTLTWSTGGTYTVTATASNPAGKRSGSHAIDVIDDSDSDGISDHDEYYGTEGDTPFCDNTTQDTDRDGIPDCRDNNVDGDIYDNYLDDDSDGDGILDEEEGTGDSDGDGIPNFLDPHYYLYLPLITRNY